MNTTRETTDWSPWSNSSTLSPVVNEHNHLVFGYIQIRLRDDNHVPVAFATVRLLQGNTVMATAQTNADGAYIMALNISMPMRKRCRQPMRFDISNEKIGPCERLHMSVNSLFHRHRMASDQGDLEPALWEESIMIDHKTSFPECREQYSWLRFLPKPIAALHHELKWQRMGEMIATANLFQSKYDASSLGLLWLSVFTLVSIFLALIVQLRRVQSMDRSNMTQKRASRETATIQVVGSGSSYYLFRNDEWKSAVESDSEDDSGDDDDFFSNQRLDRCDSIETVNAIVVSLGTITTTLIDEDR